MPINVKRKRQFLIFFLFSFAFLSIIFRLYCIQVTNHPTYKDRADLQHNILIKLEPKRGAVYDNINRILAINIDTESVYAVANDITEKEKVSTKLSKTLDLKKDFLLGRLNRKKSFVWIKRKINDNEAEAVKGLNIEGIALLKETKRFYPNDNLGCHFLGFTDIDNRGLEGIELYYDTFLKGRYGWKSTLRDAKKILVQSHVEYLPPREGLSIVLTIDEVMQHIVEQEMREITRIYRPKSIMIIVIEPLTGAILAMANHPNYNPNYYETSDQDTFKNRAIADTFEPGSVFKIVTASAVLEEGIVKLEDNFYCENGIYKIKKRVLHDYRPYQDLTFREVIEKSSNIGTVKAAAKLGKDKLNEYIERFGFGKKTGIDLPGEENGILRNSSTWSYVDMTTIPIGHGISCTALQLANAISIIANGGKFMKPFIVKSVIDEELNTVKNFTPKSVKRVLSEETALKMKHLLHGVVENGTGKRARTDGYKSGGKTGTAQKVDKSGMYSKSKYTASFVGFAPLDKPRIALAICVDEPKVKYFGSLVAAPAFSNITGKILRYLEVPQDAEEQHG